MGNVVTQIQKKFLSNLKKLFSTGRSHSVTMIGLDASGKTTLLYRMKTGDIQHTVPTIGFNCETLTIGDLKFQVWDIGGQEIFIKFWLNYIKTSSAIVYLVDIADTDRYEQASDALWSVVKELNEHKPLLILANKCDLCKNEIEKENAVNQLVEVFHLDKYNAPKNIVACSVKDSCSQDVDEAKSNSKNILGAFSWLSEELKKMPCDS
ncbi:adp ribosylation factor 1 [Vairimorpha apis BRL 01]|uniref:Adp ribosylation factor 1 n=1 Tax=Vairimorpha apis BRL 01 TaxID=1037528 RepID=T0L4J9_9MICR|nr:adp ribosylation factor 1 [Vairimorpha apis BRL 01]